MKLVQFTYPGNPKEIRAGYVIGDDVVDFNKADSSLPKTLFDILNGGFWERALKVKGTPNSTIPLSKVRLEAPITGMDKVLCVGLNYRDHCEEQKLTPPAVPMFFSKFSRTVIGPNDAVKLRSDVTQCVDYEVEQTVVIGKVASNVSQETAFQYVLGYTVGQDIGARDWLNEKNAGQVLLGKAMDTFCPIGPWIVTSDEVGDPHNLDVKCSINGDLRQNSNTKQLIRKIPEIIARLTSVMTLYPGDIILTGTPGGVGMYRNPPEYLKPGDIITTEIQNIGTLTTKVEHFLKM